MQTRQNKYLKMVKLLVGVDVVERLLQEMPLMVAIMAQMVMVVYTTHQNLILKQIMVVMILVLKVPQMILKIL